jgi:hypothetical protein
MTITFAQAIKELAELCGAVAAQGTATGGSATTLLDPVGLGAAAVGDQLDVTGLRLYIWAGTGTGQERPLTGIADPGAAQWTFAGTAPDSTSKWILLQGGWSVAQLKAAWVNAIRAERRHFLVPKVDESITLSMSPTATYEYTVPAGFVAIQDILREESVGSGNFVRPLLPEVWWVNKAAGKIVFDKAVNDRFGFLVHGAKLRILGQAYETEPTSDSSVLQIPTGNLVWLAAANAYNMRATQDVGDVAHIRDMAARFQAVYQARAPVDFVTVWPGSRLVEGG